MSLEAYLTICDVRYAMCCKSEGDMEEGFVVVEVNNVECPTNVSVSPDLLRPTKAAKVPDLHEGEGHCIAGTDTAGLQGRADLLERRGTSVQESMGSFADVIKQFCPPT